MQTMHLQEYNGAPLRIVSPDRRETLSSTFSGVNQQLEKLLVVVLPYYDRPLSRNLLYQ